jgi:archaellum biogenesis ATPase FlaH
MAGLALLGCDMEKENPLQKTFIIELALLKALAIREHYDNYFSYVVYDRLLEETRVFLDAYKLYYELYPTHKEIDFDTFLTQFVSNWHSSDMHQEQIAFYTQAIITVKKAPLDDAETALIGLINRQLMDKITKIGNKSFNSEQIREELEQYDVKRAGILREYDLDAFTIEDVDFAEINKSTGLPYAMEPLQDALGGMVKGSLVVLNAASGIGKSAFIHTQVVHSIKWLKQANNKKPILFFNTEGTSSEVFGRMLSNLYRETMLGGYREILASQAKLQNNFIKNFGKETFIVFTANDMGLNYVRMKIKKYKPALVILDMAAAIMTAVGKSSGETQDLKVFFNSLRNISSDNCPIIATVQAGNGAKYWDKNDQKYIYKQWPTDDDIYGSKTAVQGAAETIITIGRDNEHEFTRYIQTTKLKSDADKAKFICELNRKFSHYKVIDKVRSY